MSALGLTTHSGSFLMTRRSAPIQAHVTAGIVTYIRRAFREVTDQYEKMIPECGLTEVDATLPIEVQQAQVRQIVHAHLDEAQELRVRP